VLDSHVHIGQFNEKYYHFDAVFTAIFSAGKVDKIRYSSTSSCIQDVKYGFVRKEIEDALNKYPADMAIPLFWLVPDYINQGMAIKTAMNDLPYGGFKLHSYGNKWDFENDKKQRDTLHELFDYADDARLPILIHTGESGVDRPDRFERFFAGHENARIILAHCRPPDETTKLMEKHPNILGDTAFASKDGIDEIKRAGFGARLLFGTDFPITHYFRRKSSGISLQEQYKLDLEQAEWIKPA